MDPRKFANRHQGLIDARWREYLPTLTCLARRDCPLGRFPEQILEEWKATFYRRIRILFDYGVRWPTIRKLRMDDPWVEESSFLAALQMFRERSARYGPHTGSHEHYWKNFEKRYAKEQEKEFYI